MAPQLGLEPKTLRLTAARSTIELLRHLYKSSLFSYPFISDTPSWPTQSTFHNESASHEFFKSTGDNLLFYGSPDGIRTRGLLIDSQQCWPLHHRATGGEDKICTYSTFGASFTD